MAKHIDADRLKEEFQKRFDICKRVSDDDRNALDTQDWYRGKYTAYSECISFIDSLQQEPPEVDLDEEIDNYFYPKNFKRVNDGVEFPGWHVSDWKNPNVGKKLFTDDLRRFARHFYELGRARKEE